MIDLFPNGDLWLLELLRLTIMIGFAGVLMILLALGIRLGIALYDKVRDRIEGRGGWWL